MTINLATKMLTDSAAAIEARQSKYGPPNKNFKCIAALWTAYLQGKYGELATIKLDEADVAAMSGLIKVARLAETPDHEDSWVDMAGYAACGRQVTAKKVPEYEFDITTLLRDKPSSEYPIGWPPSSAQGLVTEKFDWRAELIPPHARAYYVGADGKFHDAGRVSDIAATSNPDGHPIEDYRLGDTTEMQTTGPIEAEIGKAVAAHSIKQAAEVSLGWPELVKPKNKTP